MLFFDVDFNRGMNHLFTIVHTDEEDWHYMRKQDLPAVGETVFVLCAEYQTSENFDIYDSGFGFVTKVKAIWQNERTEPNDYIIDFEKPTEED